MFHSLLQPMQNIVAHIDTCVSKIRCDKTHKKIGKEKEKSRLKFALSRESEGGSSI